MTLQCIGCGNARQCCYRCGFTDKEYCCLCSLDLRCIDRNRVICYKCLKKYRCNVPHCMEPTVRVCKLCKVPQPDCQTCCFHHPYGSICDRCLRGEKPVKTQYNDTETISHRVVDDTPQVYAKKMEAYEKYKLLRVKVPNRVDHANNHLTDEDMQYIYTLFNLDHTVVFVYHSVANTSQ